MFCSHKIPLPFFPNVACHELFRFFLCVFQACQTLTPKPHPFLSHSSKQCTSRNDFLYICCLPSLPMGIVAIFF